MRGGPRREMVWGIGVQVITFVYLIGFLSSAVAMGAVWAMLFEVGVNVRKETINLFVDGLCLILLKVLNASSLFGDCFSEGWICFGLGRNRWRSYLEASDCLGLFVHSLS